MGPIHLTWRRLPYSRFFKARPHRHCCPGWLRTRGVYLQSYGLLSKGAIITGLLWGSILACLVDRDLRKAMLFGLLASCLSLLGVIHAEQIGFSLSPIAIGYLVLTGLLGVCQLIESRREKVDELTVSGRVAAQEYGLSREGEALG